MSRECAQIFGLGPDALRRIDHTALFVQRCRHAAGHRVDSGLLHEIERAKQPPAQPPWADIPFAFPAAVSSSPASASFAAAAPARFAYSAHAKITNACVYRSLWRSCGAPFASTL